MPGHTPWREIRHKKDLFRYRLHSRDGDDLGEFRSMIPNWSVGEEIVRGDGDRLRIVAIVWPDESERSVIRAFMMVESVPQ